MVMPMADDEAIVHWLAGCAVQSADERPRLRR
jgi:hypothetical protein